MPDRTDGWTVETLRVYLQRQHDDLMKLLDERSEAQDKAIHRLDTDYGERFRAVNEFQRQQGDIIARFVPRQEYEAAHAALLNLHQADVKQLIDRLGELQTLNAQRVGADVGVRTREQQITTQRNQIILAISVVIAAAGVILGAIIAFKG